MAQMLKMKKGVQLSKFESEMSAALLNVDIHSSGFMYGLVEKDNPDTVIYNHKTGYLEKVNLRSKETRDWKSLNQYLRMLPSIDPMMQSRSRNFAFTAIADAVRSNTDTVNWYWFIPKSILAVTKEVPQFNRQIGIGFYRLSAVPLRNTILKDGQTEVHLAEETEHQLLSVNRGFEAFYLIELPYHNCDLMIFEPELNGLSSVFKRIKQVEGFVKSPY